MIARKSMKKKKEGKEIKKERRVMREKKVHIKWTRSDRQR